MTRRETDGELIEALKSGDTPSFEELLRRYSTKVMSLALRLTRNKDDAEEVLQDVFITVHRKLDAFEGKSQFSSWLYRITVNSALMKLRKRKQEKATYLEDVLPHYQDSSLVKTGEDEQGDKMAIRGELIAALTDAIEKLPEEYRPVFVLRDVDGLTSKEVGKMLDLTIPAVKSRLHRSRLMIRRRLLPIYREFVTGKKPDKDAVGA